MRPSYKEANVTVHPRIRTDVAEIGRCRGIHRSTGASSRCEHELEGSLIRVVRTPAIAEAENIARNCLDSIRDMPEHLDLSS